MWSDLRSFHHERTLSYEHLSLEMRPKVFWVHKADICRKDPLSNNYIHVREISTIDWKRIWSTLEKKTGMWLGQRTEMDIQEIVDQAIRGDE